jgi:hypothetical protein
MQLRGTLQRSNCTLLQLNLWSMLPMNLIQNMQICCTPIKTLHLSCNLQCNVRNMEARQTQKHHFIHNFFGDLWAIGNQSRQCCRFESLGDLSVTMDP